MFPERIDWGSPKTWVALVLFGGLALVPLAAELLAQPFYLTMVTRILIYALAASSLNLILGYGGMVSFGHALYLGLGAYAVGLLSHHDVTSGWAHLAVALAVAAPVALLTGLVCLRTSGIAFIMITLAFTQMFFFLGISLKQYGGDDGLNFATRSDFGLFDFDSAATLYYATFLALVGFLFLSWRLVHSRFGAVLRGAKSNERRMKALGFPILRYQVAAYVIAACVCAVAGLLLANLTRFTTPTYMAWQVSGELIVMVVLGGMGTIVGPTVGAGVFLLFEEMLPGLLEAIDHDWKPHWMVVLGPAIVLIVLLAKLGLWGSFSRWADRLRSRR